jgi:hypothetical protein
MLYPELLSIAKPKESIIIFSQSHFLFSTPLEIIRNFFAEFEIIWTLLYDCSILLEGSLVKKKRNLFFFFEEKTIAIN